MKLPDRILFTGAPGSKWSGVAQTLEQDKRFNTSDRTPERIYSHHEYGGHKGVYFGKGMEFEAVCSNDHLDYPFSGTGTRLLKSHEWAYHLDLYSELPDFWIMMVHRDDQECFEWWKQAGGFDISYPNYDWYKDDVHMKAHISLQNKSMIDFCTQHNVDLERWSSKWLMDKFQIKHDVADNDIRVALFKCSN